MLSAESQEVVRKGEALYRERLQESLEKTHRGYFVAIEPESGDYYLGRRAEEAIDAARSAHPDRISYTVKVGFPAAFEIGGFHDGQG